MPITGHGDGHTEEHQLDVTRTMGVQLEPATRWARLFAWLRPAPPVPPAWHAPRPNTTGPGRGRHRCTAGGVLYTYRLPSGDIITFRRRP